MQKKLIILSSSFPYGFGESFLGTELTYLAKQFQTIIILPLSKDKKDYKRKLPDNVAVLPPLVCARNLRVKIVFFAQAFFSISDVLKLLILALRSNKFRFNTTYFKHLIISSMIGAVAYRKLRTFLTQPFPMIYSYWGHNLATSLLLIPSPTVKICRFHRVDLYALHHEIPDSLPFQRAIMQASNILSFVSKHGLDYAKSCYPELANKMHLDYLGINDAPLSRQSEDGLFRIVTCSFLTPVKRIPVLIEALSLCSGLHIEWTHIGNGGSNLAQVEEPIRNLPSTIHAKLLGTLSNQKVRTYYANNPVDLFINISESEGLPVSIMEAFCAGIPVLAGDVGGIQEIVNPQVGWLIQPVPDRFLLAKVIREIYHLPRNEMSAKRNAARVCWKTKWNADVNYERFSMMLSDLFQET